jgi:ribosomal protein S18 acetylase RimI-like enzyme
MRIRSAVEADQAVLRELWEEFEAEVPPPPGFDETWDEAWPDIARHIAEGVALIAEDDEGPAGYLWARAPERGTAHVTDAYVRPRARRRGVTKALLRAAIAELRTRDVERVTLDVLTTNTIARSVWERLGFVEVQRLLAAPLGALEDRLASDAPAASFGSIHIQTDDIAAVERAVAQFVPRLGVRSRESRLVASAAGWIAVHDDGCDRNPQALRRLARELSDRLGAVTISIGVEEDAVVRVVVLERGRIVDEYLSVPEFYGSLPPGEIVALSFNPTVAARLTGADAGRLRALARTARSPGELPPPRELVATIGAEMGLETAELPFDRVEGAVSVRHG